MEPRLKRVDVEAAKEDLKNRSLAKLSHDFARLIYVASLRDFSTGEYYHQGLAQSFSQSAASAAMTACHEELFYCIALGPLDTFVAQLDRLISSTHRDYHRTLEVWETLAAYNLAIPSGCDETTAGLFRSNVKIAMTFLKSRHLGRQEKSQSALPRPLLGR